MKKSSNVIWAACTACERMMSVMPSSICPWLTTWVELPSPAKK